METRRFRLLRMRPSAAVVMPLPTELTTPPVTKMYFGIGPREGREKQRQRQRVPPNHDRMRGSGGCQRELVKRAVRRRLPGWAAGRTVEAPSPLLIHPGP